MEASSNRYGKPGRANIVGLTGYAGSGKTSTADILANLFSGRFKVQHLADALKHEAAAFYNIPVKTFISVTKKDKPLSLAVEPADDISRAITATIGARDYFTPRDLLVAYGAFRRFYSPMYWVDKVMGMHMGPEVLLVPDIRYQNEYDFLRSIGGSLVRVTKLGHGRTRNDASETEQEAFKPDRRVKSLAGLDKLKEVIIVTELGEYLLGGGR